MKARYFQKTSFFDAKHGGTASWAWSILLAGRYLITNGAHWQIMNGENTRLWVDRWILSLERGHPILLNGVIANRSQTVSSIINHPSCGWQIDSICKVISLEDLNGILNTPIGDGSRADQLVWTNDRRGKYLVKASYHWLHSGVRKGQTRRPSSSSVIDPLILSRFWKMDAP